MQTKAKTRRNQWLLDSDLLWFVRYFQFQPDHSNCKYRTRRFGQSTLISSIKSRRGPRPSSWSSGPTRVGSTSRDPFMCFLFFVFLFNWFFSIIANHHQVALGDFFLSKVPLIFSIIQLSIRHTNPRFLYRFPVKLSYQLWLLFFIYILVLYLALVPSLISVNLYTLCNDGSIHVWLFRDAVFVGYRQL